jgi:type I restriction enzyme S subunit
MAYLSEHQLKELIKVTRGAALSGAFFEEEGVLKRLTLGNFDYENGGFKDNTSKDNLFYSGSVASNYILKEGDIITPLTEQTPGLLGSTAKIPESGKYIQSQDIGLVSCYEEKIDKDFCYYLLPSEIVKKQLASTAQQTKIRHTSPDKIEACTVFIPNPNEQKKVGKLLTTIDKLIDFKRKENAILDSIAKQIYDYWFVQFDFPNEEGKPYKSLGGKMEWNETLKREIPKGWRDDVLEGIANITMGQSPVGTSLNDKGDGILFYQGSTDFGVRFPKVRMFTTAPTRYAKRGDILLSVRAPVGAINIANADCCIGRGLAALNSKINAITHLYFVLGELKSKYEIINNTGTTFGAINKDQLHNLSIVRPTDDIIMKFESRVHNIFIKQMKIDEEINELQSLRDYLLPLLMNGQVTIKD